MRMKTRDLQIVKDARMAVRAQFAHYYEVMGINPDAHPEWATTLIEEPAAWLVDNDYDIFSTVDDPTDRFGGYTITPLYTAEQLRAAVLAELERLALEWERIHGFDKHGVAAFIRDGKVKGYRSDKWQKR